MLLTAQQVLAATRAGSPRCLASTYHTRDGREFLGLPVSQVGSALVAAGHRGQSRIDEIDLRDLGCQVVDGEYTKGLGRVTGKFIRVLMMEWR